MFTYVYIYADVELYSYQYVSISIFFHIICLPMSLVPPASGCEPSDKIEMRACNTQSCCWAVVCSQNRCGLGLVGRMIFFYLQLVRCWYTMVWFWWWWWWWWWSWWWWCWWWWWWWWWWRRAPGQEWFKPYVHLRLKWIEMAMACHGHSDYRTEDPTLSRWSKVATAAKMACGAPGATGQEPRNSSQTSKGTLIGTPRCPDDCRADLGSYSDARLR